MSRLLNEDDVVKIIDEHTDNNGALDSDITCILEDVPSQMSAVEVLEWLRQGCYDDRFANILDNSAIGDINYLLDNLDTQEIVDRIEEYKHQKEINDLIEKGKNQDLPIAPIIIRGTNNSGVGNIEQEFKVGDWVIFKSAKYEIMQICVHNGNVGLTVRNPKTHSITNLWAKNVEHAEPPKEEEQKIKKIDIDSMQVTDWYELADVVGKTILKINELVDAVNELSAQNSELLRDLQATMKMEIEYRKKYADAAAKIEELRGSE